MLDLLPDLAPWVWAILVLGAIFVGLSKTAIPGVNTLAVAMFAALLPARASTGALLILLLLGDVFALAIYRRHADWGTLIRLAPAIVIGMAAGAVFLAFADDSGVRTSIGIILLVLMAFTLWQRYRASKTASGPKGQRLAQLGYGSLGGFTTMVANAGSGPLSMYFIAARFNVNAFLGTVAWLFAMMNVAKLPVSIGLGILTPETFVLDLVLAPAVVFGALLGWWIANRIRQSIFDWAVIIATIAGAIYLLL